MFYGWYIALAGSTLNMLVGGITYYGFTAMINPIASTFGWSYAQISLAMTLRGIEASVLNPIIGFVVDRWPARRLVATGIFLIGAGLFLLSMMDSLWMLYLSFIIIAIGASLGIYMVPMSTVVRWFRRNVGKATSLITIGIGLGGLMVPLVTYLIDNLGWRTSLMVLAGVVWLVGIPLAFVYRDWPQKYGLLPDGSKQKTSDDGDVPAREVFGVGIKQALRTRAFWQIGAAYMLQVAGFSAAVLHMMPYLTSIGIDRAVASTIALAIPLASIPGRFAFGWLGDVFNKRHMAAISMGLTSLGLFLLFAVETVSFWMIIIFVIIFGTGVGGFTPLIPPITREYFGTRKFGTVYGFISGYYMLGSIVSPPLIGLFYDIHGAYNPVWIIMGIVAIFGAVLILTVPPAPAELRR